MLQPSSTLKAGSQNPVPSCLSKLAEVVSAAAPQTTKNLSSERWKIHMLALVLNLIKLTALSALLRLSDY